MEEPKSSVEGTNAVNKAKPNLTSIFIIKDKMIGPKLEWRLIHD